MNALLLLEVLGGWGGAAGMGEGETYAERAINLF